MRTFAHSPHSTLDIHSDFPLYTCPDAVAKYLKKCRELYTWQRHERPATKGGASNTFVLQDGPPYANGSLHIGHALNKVVKDVICRAKVAQGMRVDFTPGSDCHGLPVELKVLESLCSQQAMDKDADALKIRSMAKSYVQGMIKEHIRVFKSWGLMADWDNHWKTMDRDFELRQLRVFQTIAKHGLIFRSNRPVYWSPSTHTALAEAELEYQDDYTSSAAFVKISLTATYLEKPLSAVVWTTEPWTLPANQAIAINRGLKYVIARSKQHGNLIVAETRLRFLQEHLQEDLDIMEELSPRTLFEYGYTTLSQFNSFPQNRPIIHADFVTATSGTGFVNCAPGHSFEAYQALQSHIHAGTAEVKVLVDDFGKFTEAASSTDPALLQGQFCLAEGNESVLKLLKGEGLLLACYKFHCQHPIDWRSRGPVIVRATSQWFLDVSEIRSDILAALNKVHFQPHSGRERLLSFAANRTDWCISRQRPWGVPLPALYHKQSGEAVMTDASVGHIIDMISRRGVDAWWSNPADDPSWCVDGLAASEYIRGTDTLDVWFDNGSSWSRLAALPGVDVPPNEPRADVYFEGRDQLRCWFQTSVLTSIAFQKAEHPDRPPHAPFARLMTHGFALDCNGQKMSKSLGNITTYQQIVNGIGSESALQEKDNDRGAKYLGPDVLRLWAACNDWENDFHIRSTMIADVHKALAKYRATIKLLLDMLSDFAPTSELLRQWTLQLDQLQLDRYAMSTLLVVIDAVKHHLQTSFEIYKATAAIDAYVTQHLSELFLLSVQDTMDGSSTTSQRRSFAQVTLYHIFTQLQQMLGPIVPLLIEESHDYTPEPIRKFAGHPFHRVWEPLDAQIVNMANGAETEEVQEVQLEAITLDELPKAELAVEVSVEEVVEPAL